MEPPPPTGLGRAAALHICSTSLLDDATDGAAAGERAAGAVGAGSGRRAAAAAPAAGGFGGGRGRGARGGGTGAAEVSGTPIAARGAAALRRKEALDTGAPEGAAAGTAAGGRRAAARGAALRKKEVEETGAGGGARGPLAVDCHRYKKRRIRMVSLKTRSARVFLGPHQV